MYGSDLTALSTERSLLLLTWRVPTALSTEQSLLLLTWRVPTALSTEQSLLLLTWLLSAPNNPCCYWPDWSRLLSAHLLLSTLCFCLTTIHLPTNIMGASGQWCLISGYHFDVTFSKDDGLVTLKQIRNTSVWKCQMPYISNSTSRAGNKYISSCRCASVSPSTPDSLLWTDGSRCGHTVNLGTVQHRHWNIVSTINCKGGGVATQKGPYIRNTAPIIYPAADTTEQQSLLTRTSPVSKTLPLKKLRMDNVHSTWCSV
jgi:hypothetical protein